jgi:nucleoside-diphosphate-sugar epimerase
MSKLAIVGASSFIGLHFLNTVQAELVVRALSRNPNPGWAQGRSNLQLVSGDLLDQDSLNELVAPESIVINMAYLESESLENNLKAMRNLAEICAQKKVKRVIHCSTVMVCGDTSTHQIDENTPCLPRTEYETIKFQTEQLWLSYTDQFEVAILRPSAVFGVGGKNLLKLKNDLKNGPLLSNYIKSCLCNKRSMNLVSVENVVAALQFLMQVEKLSENIFIISDDDAQNNNYRYVEACILQKLGKNYVFPLLNISPKCLALIAKASKKMRIYSRRKFYGKNLELHGFQKPVNFEEALLAFLDECVQE